jgi:hypothetical protein
MGSANLNDRSQKVGFQYRSGVIVFMCLYLSYIQGDGDSEIALVVEDSDMIHTTMDGKPYKAARFAATLRRKLFRGSRGYRFILCHICWRPTPPQNISDLFLPSYARNVMKPSRRSWDLHHTWMRTRRVYLKTRRLLIRCRIRHSISGTIRRKRIGKYSLRYLGLFRRIWLGTGMAMRCSLSFFVSLVIWIS